MNYKQFMKWILFITSIWIIYGIIDYAVWN